MSTLRRRLDSRRYKRHSTPPANNLKKKLQQESHRIHKESMPTMAALTGTEVYIGRNWELYRTLVFVPKDKHPGPTTVS